MMRRKCIICETRPVVEGDAAGYCKVCADRIAAGKSAKSAQDDVRAYLTYQGKVVALKPCHIEAGVQIYDCVRVYKDPATLPKSKTLDLNHYCEGYNREQIKKFKRVFALMAS